MVITDLYDTITILDIGYSQFIVIKINPRLLSDDSKSYLGLIIVSSNDSYTLQSIRPSDRWGNLIVLHYLQLSIELSSLRL